MQQTTVQTNMHEANEELAKVNAALAIQAAKIKDLTGADPLDGVSTDDLMSGNLPVNGALGQAQDVLKELHRREKAARARVHEASQALIAADNQDRMARCATLEAQALVILERQLGPVLEELGQAGSLHAAGPGRWMYGGPLQKMITECSVLKVRLKRQQGG